MNVITSFLGETVVDLLPEYPLFCWSRRVLGDGHRPRWLRNCENPRYLWRIFGGYQGLDESWFRITIGQPDENRALLEVFRRLSGVDSSRDFM